jgi:hypothetical protein
MIVEVLEQRYRWPVVFGVARVLRRSVRAAGLLLGEQGSGLDWTEWYSVNGGRRGGP